MLSLQVVLAGLMILGTALIADLLAHVTGWEAAEGPIHIATVAGMAVILAGVLVRGLTSHRREPSHAHR